MNSLNKETIMAPVVAGYAHEAFTHETEGTFDVTEMREWIKGHPELLITVELSNLIGFIKENRVTDDHRIRTLPESSWRDDPGIAIECDDGSMLMIDGHHRALRRELEGLHVMEIYAVPMKDAIRPQAGYMRGPDWGDPIVDGKIIRSAE